MTVTVAGTVLAALLLLAGQVWGPFGWFALVVLFASVWRAGTLSAGLAGFVVGAVGVLPHALHDPFEAAMVSPAAGVGWSLLAIAALGCRSATRSGGVRPVGLAAVVIVIGAAAGLKLHGDVTVARLERAYPAVGRFVSAEGVQLHYVERGSGRPVVLIHGSPGTLHDLAVPLLDRLAGDHRVIVIDRPGHGYSDRPDEPLTLRVHARLLHRALQELDIRHPLLIGHSYGGAVALRYALDHPGSVAGIVLVGATSHPTPFVHPAHVVPAIPVLGPALVEIGAVPLYPRLADTSEAAAFHPAAVPVEQRWIAQSYARRPWQFANTAEEQRHLPSDLRMMQDRYPQLRAPVVLLYGEQDRIVAPEGAGLRLHNELPNSLLVSVPDAGHQLPHTHPDIIREAVERTWQMRHER